MHEHTLCAGRRMNNKRKRSIRFKGALDWNQPFAEPAIPHADTVSARVDGRRPRSDGTGLPRLSRRRPAGGKDHLARTAYVVTGSTSLIFHTRR